ncbi:ankyrin repeat domain-containing protein [Mesorhizobium sp. M0184]|uniref:ankyrin repeat domain-containing protein n=1 Tax=Mesorhizobium sp. M0184 TaxID=2956906 RepID=UPI00333DAD3B
MTVYRRLLLARAFPIRVRLFETGWLRLVSRALVVAFISWFAVGAVTAGPLNDAAREGDAGKVAELLAQGANVNDRDESRQTPLIDAALAGKTEVAIALIGAKADIEARNDRGFTALHAAAYSGSLDIAKLLLDHGPRSTR